jgi:hypothetical protein
MGLSKECQEYHLTPRGWVKGTFHGDFGDNKVDIPSDRVLTIGCYDKQTSPYSKTKFYDRVIWESEDKELIKQLKKKYGKRPNWFGYAERKK